MLAVLATHDVETEESQIQGQPGKLNETLPQTKK